MNDVIFQVHPKHLANLFSNLVAIGKTKAGELEGAKSAMLRYNWDDDVELGQIEGLACSRFSAGMDWLHVQGGTPGGYAELPVLLVNDTKTDIVDDLAKLSTGLRGLGTAQDLRVHVTMGHYGAMTITHNDTLVGELGSTGTRYDALFTRIEDELDVVLQAPRKPTPTAFNIDLLARLKDVKATGMPATWGMVDMFHHAELDVVGVAVGPTFRGLIGSIDRGAYGAVEDQQAHLF